MSDSLPPAIEARLDDFQRIAIAFGYQPTKANDRSLDEKRSALEAEIGKEIERYATLRRLLFEDMGSVEQMRTYAPATFDALVDKFAADFAASRPPAPRTAQ